MEIDLDTMLDIALGGPEIGPLNLQVLHGVMREVFQRIEISNRNIVVEEDSADFCNSFNFIKSKVDEKNKRVASAGGTPPTFKSKVSIIVSDYVRDHMSEKTDENKTTPPSYDIEDRLRYIESELKNVKDFPSVDELRSWTKEKTNADTVVTDLWHFVSLNHRVNGLEEGIQKLTKLVDKLIPELKSLGEEQHLVNGKVDDLYSQFKGISDRLTYIDNKGDSSIDDLKKNIEGQIHKILGATKHIEIQMNNLPKFKDIDKLVTTTVFNEAQELARGTVKDLRAQISTKVNYSILEEMVGKDDFMTFVDLLNSLETKFLDCVKLIDLDRYVTNDVFSEVQKNTKSIASELDTVNVALSGKANVSIIDDMAIKSDIDKLTKRIEDLAKATEDQCAIDAKLSVMEEKLKKKADNEDVVDVLKKEDMKKTFNKIQNHQCALNEIQTWLKSFESTEKPLLNCKVDKLMDQASEFKQTLSVLHDEHVKPKEKIDVPGLQYSIKLLNDQFNEHSKTCNSNISGILNNIELKLDKAELQPLKDYLESCYNTLAEQHQDSLNEIPPCVHHPKPPKSQSMPYISQSSINISKKSVDELCTSDAFIHSKCDAAVVRSQMKYNCLSCSQPLSASGHNQFQTVRGKPLNAYELDHLRLLQKMLKPDDEENGRACGGRHTSSMPYKKTSKTSAKSVPAMAFANQEGILIDGEVDIEGLDGKLYRGLISRKDFIRQNRCRSANAELRTVNHKPGSGRDRPISGKSVSDFRSPNYARVTAT